MILNFNDFQIVGKAQNGQEAVSMYQTLTIKPDVIIMDHRMPVKNGLDASKEILQINSNALIIFASADKNIKSSAIAIGATLFLSKPFSCETLVKCLNDVVNHKLN